MPTTSVQISVFSDDAEEKAAGSSIPGDMDRTSSDLEFIHEISSGDDQLVGMRFDGLAVPAGATVTNAYIRLVVDESDSGTTDLVFWTEAHDDPPTFSTADYDISSRTLNSGSVEWNAVPAFVTPGDTHDTPDLSSIIQPVIDRAGWNSGQAVVVVVTGSGTRTAEAYDGVPASAPTLFVTYTTGGAVPIMVHHYRQRRIA